MEGLVLEEDEMTMSNIINDDFSYIFKEASYELAQLQGKKILIVGGAGFLGYYLVQSLASYSKEAATKLSITVIDNFKRGYPAWLKHLAERDEVNILELDITIPITQSLPPYDFIIHAASIASPTFYRKYPIETMDANVNGLRNLLDFAISSRDKTGKSIVNFLYFSTSEIYGDPDSDNIPTKETYRGFVSCTGPRASYDEPKRYGETMSVNFAKVHDLPISIARPFNNYGPGLNINDGRVIPDFAKNIISNEDIILLSDGSPKRTFCYVADAIIGYLKILISGHKGESYNIGIEEPEVSIKELALMMQDEARKLFDYKGELRFANSKDEHYLTDNPNRRCPSIKKARDHLGFNPSISLSDGLNKSLRWYAQNSEV